MAEEKQTNNELLKWEFSEFTKQNRSGRWYLVFGILAFIGIAYGVIADNYLFSVIIVMFILIIFLQDWRDPDQVQFSVTAQGVYYGEQFIEMNKISEFWIVYKPPLSKFLYIQLDSIWRPALVIPLEDMNPITVRDVLKEYLDENLEERDEQISESLSRVLKL